MADIRKRTGSKGKITYQVRYPTRSANSRYTYTTFNTLKEAREFVEGGKTRDRNGASDQSIRTVPKAVEKWLTICEKEGTDGSEPVTRGTLDLYEYHAEFMKAYPWPKDLPDLATPDIVEFRSWLLSNSPSRYVARKTLSYFHGVLNEMTIRNHVASNVATGVGIKADSRYDEPLVIPSRDDVAALLSAADDLATSKNERIRNTWKRYRPILYLAVDSGMRPQEYLALARSAIHKNGIKIDRAIEGDGKKLSVPKTAAGRRFIEIGNDTLEMLREYVKNHSVRNDYDLVFPTDNGKWQSRRNWQRRGFNQACKAAGLMRNKVTKEGKPVLAQDGDVVTEPKYTPYHLRHFYASVLFAKKTNPKKIQTLMGHEDIATTLETYAHLIEGMHDPSEEGGVINDVRRKNSCGESVAKAI